MLGVKLISLMISIVLMGCMTDPKFDATTMGNAIESIERLGKNLEAEAFVQLRQDIAFYKEGGGDLSIRKSMGYVGDEARLELVLDGLASIHNMSASEIAVKAVDDRLVLAEAIKIEDEIIAKKHAEMMERQSIDKDVEEYFIEELEAAVYELYR